MIRLQCFGLCTLHKWLLQERHFNYFLGGAKFFFFKFFNATGLLKNLKKNSTFTSSFPPFFLYFFLFFLFLLSFFLFSFSLGDNGPPALSNGAPGLLSLSWPQLVVSLNMGIITFLGCVIPLANLVRYVFNKLNIKIMIFKNIRHHNVNLKKDEFYASESPVAEQLLTNLTVLL